MNGRVKMELIYVFSVISPYPHVLAVCDVWHILCMKDCLLFSFVFVLNMKAMLVYSSCAVCLMVFFAKRTPS
jgi:hypothetical protein